MNSRDFFVVGAVALAVISYAPEVIAGDDTPKRPPVDRTLAEKNAPQFADEIEAALTQPVMGLYNAAQQGVARDKWIFGLAQMAERHTLEPMSAAQRALYLDYAQRLENAKAKYQKKHRNKDISEMPDDTFVKPTPEEIEAIRAAKDINSPDIWLNAARATAPESDGPVITQSVACLTAVKDKVDADDLMVQLLNGLGGAMMSSASGKSGDGATIDLAQISKELDDSPKSDEELDDEALCGGAEAFARDVEWLKAVYKPSLTITVSTGNGN